MVVYRLVNALYKDDLSGNGAFKYGGRWNEPEHYALYAAEHISLALLELVVHSKMLLQNTNYFLLTFELPSNPKLFKQIQHQQLPVKWAQQQDVTQFIGTSFLQANTLLYLKVPSVIVPTENNFVINPKHPDFKSIKLLSSQKFDVDRRII
jgi:RES domain-containing protein